MASSAKPGRRFGASGALLVLAAAPWLIAVGPPGPETLPDAARQRDICIAELKKLNEQSAQTNLLLTEIRDVLKAAAQAKPSGG